jgi:hypothetical protein
VSKGPDLLRIDVLPLEGAYTLGMIVVRPDGATLIDTNEQKFSEATDADDLLQRFLGLHGLTPSVVKGMLTRQVPQFRCEEVSVYGSADALFTLVDTRHHVAWEIDGVSRVVRAVQLLDINNERVEARAEIVAPEGRNAEIHFSIYKPISTSAQMIVRKLSLNPTVPDELFRVAVPSGYQREH